MINKVLIPLEDIKFRGADNKVRLRYRLKSKDGNETSQWSPVYTVNPTEIRDISYGWGETINPVEFSGWAPSSFSDNQVITINTDSGWINDKFKIPCKTFDVFISYNYSNLGGGYDKWGYPISKYGTVINAYNPIPNILDSTATITDLDSIQGLTVGDLLIATTNSLATSPGILMPEAAIQSGTATVSITRIVNNSTIEIKSVSNDGGVSSKTIVNGGIKNIIKYATSTATNVYKYEGTTDSGKFTINIPKVPISSAPNIYAYKFQLTPATKPPTLTSTNFLYSSASISSNSSTIQFNTIDGGSPS